MVGLVVVGGAVVVVDGSATITLEGSSARVNIALLLQQNAAISALSLTAAVVVMALIVVTKIRSEGFFTNTVTGGA